MSRQRRSFSAKFKSDLVIELLKGEKDLNTLAAENNIQPNLLRNWKKEFLNNASLVFDDKSYGPKFVENIVQAVSRDILCYAMKTLRHCFIVGHVHDELIIECSPDVNLDVICKQMGRSPDWMPDILLRADGYETNFYKKD